MIQLLLPRVNRRSNAYRWGADAVIDYTIEDFAQRDDRYDIIFDTVSKSSFAHCKGALSKKGRYLARESFAMPIISVDIPDGEQSMYIATPTGEGPWPGVCVIHDALGMSQDLRNQADWLASEGYLAAAPDLFDGGSFLKCLRSIMRDFNRGEGPFFERIESVRQWLLQHEQSTGKVGVIGFCFGGGFALLLAPRGDFAVASVNYGGLPKDPDNFLKQSCPIVASYGALDRTLKGAAAKLEMALDAAGVEHDIREYPDTDHAFMNDHAEDQIPWMINVIAFLFGGGEYNQESTEDARKRILTFFDRYLKA